ncbi:tetratricopeptide repeat protein [Pyxidicoccus parkwayensis]|uniref:Tetratricopeptide repeat protein n=1 Tax=Pyxidicoccus parkwayensis TaxID=2813578 RepID=A0ABX7PAC4_9BACT|nr:tetratricopeptide repeat protein [Pyxidicoccus parkwaysis]QSQ27430.1 tetratricopeptide repeat protein [Pyxidicoccus parkwaysis]
MSPVREEGEALMDDLFAPLDGEAGPARRISRQKSAALVLAAMDAATHETPSRPKVRKKWPPVLLVAGAVLFTGAAAAAVWALVRAEREPESQVAHAMPEASPDASAHAPEVAPGTTVGSAQPASMHTKVTEQVSEADAYGSVPTGATEKGVGASTEVKQSDSTTPAVRKQRQGTASRPPPVMAPEDLLREANALRAGGSWKDAEALYLRVIREQPSSLAAYVARVASGSLRLEHLGNARGALRQFQEALRVQPQGVLDQEARHGIAEAWRALGDTKTEARALEEFLAHHPDSPLGTNARARLRELSSP